MALTDKLNAIGAAIRSTTGGTERIPLADMPEKIMGVASENFAQGWHDGQVLGYSKGHASGLEEGKEEGKLEGHKKGYEEGYNAGFTSGRLEGYEKGCKAGYDEGYSTGEGEGYVAGLEEGKEEGKQIASQAFWDNVPNTTEKYMFAGAAWNTDTFHPKKSFTFSGDATDHMFSSHNSHGEAYDLAQRLADCGVTFDFHLVTRANYLFYAANLTRLPVIDLSECSQLSSTFANMRALVTFDALGVSPEATFSNTFRNCENLENITIMGEIGNNIDFSSCTKLSHDSLMNIIRNLTEYSGTSTTRILTLGTANLEKLTDTEKAIATGKGWTLA